MATRVLDALATHPQIGRIIVVAPPGAHGAAALARADERRADGARMILSLTSGLAGLDPDIPVVIAAADLPFLSRRALDELLTFRTATDADLAYACVHRRVHDAQFPDVPHTWARFREGLFCGGGVIVMRPRLLPALRCILDDLGRARKTPWRLARVFGFSTLARYAFGRLRIADVERRASLLLGANARAAVSPYAEIAFNVDRLEDVARAERYAQRGYGVRERGGTDDVRAAPKATP